MKKILSIILTLAMLFSILSVFETATVAATGVYTVNIEDTNTKGNKSSLLAKSTEKYISGSALKITARQSSLGGAYISYSKDGNGTVSSATRGTTLIPMSDTVPAGTYILSAWINVDDAEANPSYSVWVSFHDSAATEAGILHNLKAQTTKVCLVDSKVGKADYVGESLYIETKNANGGKWKHYQTEIYVPAEVTKAAIWANYSAGYTNTSDWSLYVDDITLTAVNGAAGIVNLSGDIQYNGCLAPATGSYHTANQSCIYLANNKDGENFKLSSGEFGGLGNVHRTKLQSLTSPLAVGTYRVSVWIAKGANADGLDFQFEVSFHNSSLSDAQLGTNLTANATAITKIYDTNDDHVFYYGTGGDAFEQTKRTGGKSVLQATGRTENGGDGKKWMEYAGIVTLSAESSKYALWFYRPANYDGRVTATGSQPYYVDDLLVTAFKPSTESIKVYGKDGALKTTITSSIFESDLDSSLAKLTESLDDEDGFKIYALKTPTGNVIGQGILNIYDSHDQPVDMLWDAKKGEYAIYTEYKDVDALQTLISYGDSEEDGKIDNIYFNSVCFNDGKLAHTCSGYTEGGKTYYYDTYDMGILFAENDYAVDASLRTVKDGGSPLFTVSNVLANEFGGTSEDDMSAGLGWYDAVLQSGDGTGLYMEDSTPVELTAANILAGTSEENNEDAKLLAVRWKNMNAFETIGARLYYVTATGYTVYCPISTVTVTEGTSVLPLAE